MPGCVTIGVVTNNAYLRLERADLIVWTDPVWLSHVGELSSYASGLLEALR